ncbi:MAG: precorrin-6y C5,15-methyltransferase (decarboxylating) subunit CbiE [Tissierellia bacterium]|nr:precorrin-6y C5,15-methyltransferase (decarboxylating) subunit CbiE [Tissierellia bacterium]
MITVAGVGPGSPEYMTLAVRDRILEADEVIAFGRVSESIAELREDVVVTAKVAEILELLEAPRGHTVVLASGDPLFYGIVDFLKRMGVPVDEVLPGLSSFQYLMAKTQIPWQNAHLFSVHGREMIIEEILKYPLSVGLVDANHSPNALSLALKEAGARGSIITGSDLSYPKERIQKKPIGETFEGDVTLAVVVIQIEMD